MNIYLHIMAKPYVQCGLRPTYNWCMQSYSSKQRRWHSVSNPGHKGQGRAISPWHHNLLHSRIESHNSARKFRTKSHTRFCSTFIDLFGAKQTSRMHRKYKLKLRPEHHKIISSDQKPTLIHDLLYSMFITFWLISHPKWVRLKLTYKDPMSLLLSILT